MPRFSRPLREAGISGGQDRHEPGRARLSSGHSCPSSLLLELFMNLADALAPAAKRRKPPPTACAVGCFFRRFAAAALVIDHAAEQLSLLPVTGSTPFRGREVFDHFPGRLVPNAVTDVTSRAFSSHEKDQIGKLTQISNWCLQFFSFICYKQSTESRSVAAGRSLSESLVSVRHLRF
jgi:hypothetical protein